MHSLSKHQKCAVYAAAAVAFAAFFAICANVYLYGDDFSYSVFAKRDFAYFVKRHVEHYYLANGRVIVHLLGTLLLALNIWVWRVLNAAALAMCAVLAASPWRGGHAPARKVLLAASVMLMTDTLVTRQSVYWLIGSLNYVYPCLMLLVLWRAFENSFDGGRVWPLYPLAFLAAATNEQGGLMTFGLVLMLILWAKFIVHKKVCAAHFAALALSFAGFLTVVLSPGLTHRADVAGTESGGLALVLDNLPRVLREIMYGYSKRSNIVMLAAAALFCGTCIPGKDRRIKAMYAFVLVAAVCTAACMLAAPKNAANLTNAGVTARFALYTAAVICGYAVSLAGAGILILVKFKDPRALAACILAVGSQIAMSASPVRGPRTVWCYIVMAAVFVCSCAEHCRVDAGKVQHKRIASAAVNVFVCGAVIAASVNWYGVYQGYRENATVYSRNLAAIEAYTEGTLVQEQLPVETCAWVMPYHNSYYNAYYNLAYDLPQKTVVEWNK